MKLRSLATLALLGMLCLGLTACAPIVGGGQPAALEGSAFPLGAGSSVGQTFAVRHTGLTAVDVFLRPEAPGGGDLVLRLREGPQSAGDLAQSVLAVSAVGAPGWYRFTFAPQGDGRRDYYLTLEVRGDGRLTVGAGPGGTYLEGALYENGEARDAQMAFRLAYDPALAAMGLAGEVVGWLGLVGLALFLYALPGWVLLTGLWSGAAALPWPQKLGLASGLSLAVYPLVLLWTSLAGLHLGAFYAWLPPVLALVVLAWRHRRWRPRQVVQTARARLACGAVLPDLTYLLLVALILGTRFYAVRGLDLPMWGDSVHHTAIAQLMVDNGGLFSSWQPYAAMQSLTYHFGFHADVAALMWLTGWGAPQATLWAGQVLNVLAVLALYPLAARLGGNRWAGVAAVLVAGLLSPMPMSYTNWGRYTQLAGQVVLPAVVYLAWEALDQQQRDWRLVSLVWLSLGGLALTHYRILIFAVIFLGAYVLLQVSARRLRSAVWGVAILGLGGGLLFLPWFAHLYGGAILANLGAKIATPPTQVSEFGQEYNAIGDLFSYLPVGLWLLLVLCLGWGLWRREKGIALMALWWFLVLLAANPAWLWLPGTGALSNFAVFIAAYIPAALIVGAAMGWTMARQGAAQPSWQVALAAVVLVGAGLWFGPRRLGDMRVAESALATRADVRAMSWIRENTPAQARFLVNSFFAYGGTVVVGSDGGWWLPLVARRESTLPPITYATEEGPRPDYRVWVNALSAQVRDKGVTHPDVLKLLQDRGVTHVYIGQQQGHVNTAGPVMEPAQMLADAHFRPVYHQDRVWVFEVVP